MFYFNHLSSLGKYTEGEVNYRMIAIDGVVGVGKTTLMAILTDAKGYVPYIEPVVNNPILDKFYHDRERYSFPLQVFFLNERFKNIKSASTHEKAVLDRSIYGDLIFAKLLRDSGDMSEEEFQIYLDLFHNMIEHCKPPALMIYLEISPEEAMKRIEKRGRDYEQKDVVEADYWIRLNHEYRDYFSQYTISPVLKINVDDLDFENNSEDRAYVLDLINNKLTELGLN
ncbi:deoxynucleoside kinase [Pullulanibacillus sp. KACC 23026]|uniref:deoxynucleoside kinase n=1 Tax=Pullulanibacillus sp. KACC 23026 TaxID=3028315 RepID=UPI0023B0D6B2|nr:deoxynucleoside kinase [Pullulanibacillus sp. KACC 23026]WEG11021.1 deoxynucleoside kinase [Pullulanibacillus sp. KACC 23026]